MLPISANEKPQKSLQSTIRARRGSAGLEAFEGLAEVGQAVGVGARVRNVGGDGRDLEQAAALLRLAAPLVVDNQAAHHPRGVAEEAVAMGKVARSRSEMSEIGACRGRWWGAERPAGTPLGQLAAGHPVQFVVEGGEQLISRDAVAALGGGEE